MADQNSRDIPQSPETQADYVREELDQEEVSHEGERRESTGTKSPEERGKHLGALEKDMVPVVPPMSGPADLVGQKDVDAQGNETGDTRVGEETVDPRRELTPG